jgi:putative peptide maturation dehydrogenase
VLWLEPREEAYFDLARLLAGETGVVSRQCWYAHAPHLEAAVEIDQDAAMLLGALSPSDWIDDAAMRTEHGAVLDAMLAIGLIVASEGIGLERRSADEQVREQHWHGLAAVSHFSSRWEGIDAAGEVAEAGLDTGPALRERFGPPPPADRGIAGDGEAIALEMPERTLLDELLDARGTCRNFDAGTPLAQASFAKVLERTFGVRGHARIAEDFEVVKKTSPSGGAMHPTEPYLIVRNVEGIAPGLYHYRAAAHALQPLPFDMDRFPPGADKHSISARKTPLDYLAWIAVGGQQWFAEAHALVVLAPHFARNYWKYRNHSKAYRVCILDAGHLSQTLLLTATELGLGAYITAAINEVDIERAFGLTHYVDGPLAICGFGPRADTMVISEFDPNRKVWPRKAKE